MANVEDILSAMESKSPEDVALVRRAYDFAEKAHEGHVRFSGEPYMAHLAHVALMLAEMRMGPYTISAALLHDTIEDTKADADDIEREFGTEILSLVEGVTKLGGVRYRGAEKHNESLRKLFVATSEDIRVLIIKLVDRLHNMQTLSHVPEAKRLRIARETLEIYAPVAHRLGMGEIRKQLEDLAFAYVFPVEYKKVTDLMREYTRNAFKRLDKMHKSVKKELASQGMTAFHTELRVKGLYSLYQKLERKDWDMDKIHDLLAIRVIVPNVDDCYRALGAIHKTWRPLPGRIKDYIAFPKPNGYQSLHTTIIAGDGNTVEVQIRTEEMHLDAQYGIASHIHYKQKQDGKDEEPKSSQRLWLSALIPSLFKPNAKEKATHRVRHSVKADLQVPQWIREIADAHEVAEDSEDFVDTLRSDFFTHRIFVFTPKGDVIDLPIESTPIDFAYAVHTDIGNHIAGVKVNNKLVNLETILRNGDIVEILTKESSKPTQKWLEIARTSSAQRKIRSVLGDPQKKKTA